MFDVTLSHQGSCLKSPRTSLRGRLLYHLHYPHLVEHTGRIVCTRVCEKRTNAANYK